MARRPTTRIARMAPAAESNADLPAEKNVDSPPLNHNRGRRWLRGPWPIILGFLLLEVIVVAICYRQWRVDWNHAKARKAAAAGDTDQAISRYSMLVGRFPHSPVLQTELGRVYFDMGRYEEALDHFRRAAAYTSSPEADLHSKTGRCLMELGDVDDALQRFQLALKLDENDPHANYALGVDRMKKGEYVKAADFLERAAFDPQIGAEARQRLKEIESIVFADIFEQAPQTRNEE